MTFMAPIMQKYPRWLAAVVLCLIPVRLARAAPTPQLRFDRISVEDGLSSSTVMAIHQDAQGFLWFATSNGLNRYDGYRFKTYKNDPQQPDSLSDNNLRVIYADRHGELWVGTRNSGLNRFRRAEESFERYRHDPADPRSLSHDAVLAVVADHADRLWVGTEDGLNLLRAEDGTFARRPDDTGGDTHLGQ